MLSNGKRSVDFELLKNYQITYTLSFHSLSTLGSLIW